MPRAKNKSLVWLKSRKVVVHRPNVILQASPVKFGRVMNPASAILNR